MIPAGLVAVPNSAPAAPYAGQNEPPVRVASANEASIGGWYASRRDEAKGLTPRTPAAIAANAATFNAPQAPSASAGVQSVTRPQQPEQARQVILEWNQADRYQPGSTLGAELYRGESGTKWR